ncbi:uncharacterized protein LOC143282780 [Babylonia areolata]|uniref:uncharacterized protein LOC143282780 n=1 Tax=Babylonia areolata TaxID=304850 RepID=UPI003FCFBD68
MKTDIHQALYIAMTSFFILSAVIRPSEGKCTGRWAIHACWGGNGKRSDPSMDVAPAPSILRQLLMRNSPLFAPSLDSREDVVPEDQSAEDHLDSSSYDGDLAEYNGLAPPPPPPSPSVSRLSALLRTLRTLQRENDALP